MLFKHGKLLHAKFVLGIAGIEIPAVHCTKFLGVWIDTQLSWKKHVNNVILRVKRNMNLLKQVGNFLDTRSKRIVYYAHIQSHVNDCISLWGNKVNGQLKLKLQKLLNKCQ